MTKKGEKIYCSKCKLKYENQYEVQASLRKQWLSFQGVEKRYYLCSACSKQFKKKLEELLKDFCKLKTRRKI